MNIEGIDIGIITAPRKLATLNVSIQSLRDAGVSNHLVIFSEPGDIDLRGVRNCTVIIHSKKKGAFKNYDYALRYLHNQGKGHRICVLEDDYIYNKSLGKKLQDICKTEERFGYFNLFTNGYHPKIGEHMRQEGWNKVEFGFQGAWGVAYVFPKEILPKLIQHPFYKEKMDKLNRCIDGTVSEVMKRMGLNMWYHNPSLSYTIGYASTLGNEFKTDGYKFRGGHI